MHLTASNIGRLIISDTLSSNHCHWSVAFPTPHRTTSLLPTPWLCTLSPPSKKTRRWCTMCAPVWAVPPIHITYSSIRHMWLSLRLYSPAQVSVSFHVHMLLWRKHCMNVCKARVKHFTSSMCVCMRLQPRAAKGEDAARIIPSVTAAQEESCSCWLCWLWPSGSEVGCTVTVTQIAGMYPLTEDNCLED